MIETPLEVLLRTVRQELGGERKLLGLADYLSREDEEGIVAFPIGAYVSEELSAEKALDLWLLAEGLRTETGYAACLVEEGAREFLLVGEGEGSDPWERWLPFAQRTLEETQPLPWDETDVRALQQSMQTQLDRLAEAAQCSIQEALQRYDGGELSEFEFGESLPTMEAFDEVDPSETTADEPREEAQPQGTVLRLQKYVPLAGANATLTQWGKTEGRYRLFLLECAPWETPIFLGFGSYNSCPPPVLHAAAWRHWYRVCSARLLAISSDGLVGSIGRPLRNVETLVRVAAELGCYDRDLLAEGSLYLVWTLYRAGLWSCWWD